MFLIAAPSANGALASLAEGRAPEPVASADAALAPEDVEPEARAAVAGAPGRVADEQARVVAFTATIVTPEEFAALATDLQGGAPVDAVASFAWAKLGRALEVAHDAGTAPKDNQVTCWVVCLATDASQCPTGLPP